LKVDYAFTDLAPDADGRAWIRLFPNDGPCRAFWADESYPYIELYTGDTLSPERRRRGLGCEPMTAPPNAFRSGEGLVRLEPGEGHTASWGVRLER
jgi:aldose 1-epimerase